LFRRCVTGEYEVFCLFVGGRTGEELKLDGADLEGVAFFGVEACDCGLGDEPPLSYR